MVENITETEKIHNELKERNKELNCLYMFSHFLEDKNILLEDIFQKSVELVPPAWQYSDVCSCRLLINCLNYVSDNFVESNIYQKENILIDDNVIGSIEVFYDFADIYQLI